MVPCLITAGCAYFYPKIYYVSCFKTKNYQHLDVGVPMTIRVSTEIGQNVKFHYPQTIPNRYGKNKCIGLILSQLEQIAIVSDIPSPFGDVSNLICFFLNYYLGTNIYLPPI